MTATERIALNLRPDEIAERVRQYHELMAPHVEAASRIIQRESWAITIGLDGSSIERVPSDLEKAVLDYITDTSRLVAKYLGIGDFFIGGS